MSRAILAALSGSLTCALSSAAHAAIDERAFIDHRLTLPQAVATAIGAVLPEGSAVGASFLSDAYSPNLVVSAPSEVFVTFVHEGAGYKNAVGYFTYTSDGRTLTILDRQLVFPNASYGDSNRGGGGGTLSPGETVTLRDVAGAPRVFAAGTQIGFFLVADGWKGGSVSAWNVDDPAIPSSDAAANARNRVMTTIDQINPEASTGFLDRARHTAMIRVQGIPSFVDGSDFLLVGLEDQRRDIASDHDFNDVVLLVRSNPVDGILTEIEVPVYNSTSPDPDKDGVSGMADAFPNDPERAFLVRTPPSGWSSIAFEDLYPNVGDGDFNDAVIEFAFEEVLRADGRVKDISGTFHLLARGASVDHRFGVALHGLPGDVSGSIAFERFTSDGLHELDGSIPVDSLLYEDLDGELSARIDQVFSSTRIAIVGVEGPFTNTTDPSRLRPPASSRFLLTFDAPLDRSSVGVPPFDPFLIVKHADNRDIHLSGFRGFPDRSAALPDEQGPRSFVDPNGYPFAMLVPKAWRYPLERVRIDGPSGAYPAFALFRTSSATRAMDWYTTPWTGRQKRVIDAMPELLRARPWEVSLVRSGGVR